MANIKQKKVHFPNFIFIFLIDEPNMNLSNIGKANAK